MKEFIMAYYQKLKSSVVRAKDHLEYFFVKNKVGEKLKRLHNEWFMELTVLGFLAVVLLLAVVYIRVG